MTSVLFPDDLLCGLSLLDSHSTELRILLYVASNCEPGLKQERKDIDGLCTVDLHALTSWLGHRSTGFVRHYLLELVRKGILADHGFDTYSIVPDPRNWSVKLR